MANSERRPHFLECPHPTPKGDLLVDNGQGPLRVNSLIENSELNFRKASKATLDLLLADGTFVPEAELDRSVAFRL
jgi:hypothetical protein